MPFNYLACSIKGTAFSEYSSLLLITREMNSLSGGASIPNATPSPSTLSTTNHHQSPRPGPPPPAARRSLRLRAPREPPERSPGRESATRSSGSRPALAPSRARGYRPAGRLNCGLRRRRPPARPPPGQASEPASETRHAENHHPSFRRVASPPRTWSPTRRSPNFLLSLHFPRQSSGPRWGWRKEDSKKENRSF